jgi:hypothetical protein
MLNAIIHIKIVPLSGTAIKSEEELKEKGEH